MTGKDDHPGEDSVPTECSGSDEHPLHCEAINPDNVQPLVSGENFAAFKTVATEFADAERRMKIVEWIEGTDVPSINELRYVGYHLLKACQIHDDPAKQLEELKRAERHCKRASFDAMELGIIYQLEKISDFKGDYEDFPVSDVLPSYLEHLALAEKTRKFLEESTGIEDRDQYYGDCEGHLETLKGVNLSLFAGRDELNKKRSLFLANEQRVNDAETRATSAEERAKAAEEREGVTAKIAKKRLAVAIIGVVIALAMLTYTMTAPNLVAATADKATITPASIQKPQEPEKAGNQPLGVIGVTH